MVGIVPSRFPNNLIKETGVFIVNLVTKEQKEMFDYLGSHSGRDEDKLLKLNIKVEERVNVHKIFHDIYESMPGKCFRVSGF